MNPASKGGSAGGWGRAVSVGPSTGACNGGGGRNLPQLGGGIGKGKSRGMAMALWRQSCICGMPPRNAAAAAGVASSKPGGARRGFGSPGGPATAKSESCFGLRLPSEPLLSFVLLPAEVLREHAPVATFSARRVSAMLLLREAIFPPWGSTRHYFRKGYVALGS